MDESVWIVKHHGHSKTLQLSVPQQFCTRVSAEFFGCLRVLIVLVSCMYAALSCSESVAETPWNIGKHTEKKYESAPPIST